MQQTKLVLQTDLNTVPLTSLLPLANQVEGRQCFQSCLTVILSMGRGIPCDHLSMMHWTSPYKDPPPPPRHVQTCSTWTSLYRDLPTVDNSHSWQAGDSHPTGMRSCYIFINADTITWQYPASVALLLMFLNDHYKIIKFNKFLHINWSWTTDWVLLTCVTRILVEAGSQWVTVISIGQWFPVIVSRFSSPWGKYVWASCSYKTASTSLVLS